ncbi:hypothetical protein D3C87_524020 [compost metagenome]
MKLLEFSTAWEPEVLGVKNGIYQLEFDESGFNNENESDDFFLNFPRDITKPITKPLNFTLLKRGKINDVMRYAPILKPAPYIVSEKFIEVLREFDTLPYSLEPVSFLNVKVDMKYFLFRYTYSDLSEFNVKRIIAYLGITKNSRKYYEFSSLSEFQIFNNKNKVCQIQKIEFHLQDSKVKDYVKLIKPGDMISERLANGLVENGITGVKIGDDCIMESVD